MLGSSVSLNNHFQHSRSYDSQQSNKIETPSKIYLAGGGREAPNVCYNGLHIVGPTKICVERNYRCGPSFLHVVVKKAADLKVQLTIGYLLPQIQQVSSFYFKFKKVKSALDSLKYLFITGSPAWLSWLSF